jgi:enamine deaminase RidA (YjgF/YER057c/UK114 family)
MQIRNAGRAPSPLRRRLEKNCSAMGHQDFVGREFVGAGGARECYLSIDVSPDLVFADQLESLRVRYGAAKAEMGLTPGSAIFRRIFLSDAMNQAERVRVSELMSAPDEGPVAVSIVQQPPAHGAKIALLAYHVERNAPPLKRTLGHHHTLIEMGGLRHLWSTRMCAAADVGPASAADQTREVFRDLTDAIAAQGGTLLNDCVRTWLYIRDVDVFYQDMVKSRTDIFKRHGLTGASHFIASTGIEGACAHHYDLVAMDAYSVFGLKPGQIRYLNDFDHLCATKDYGVTFERATRVAYGDRAHIFMSGTASIDGEGWVVHPGDVIKQLDRALENVDALLADGDARLADLTHLIVYLRDRGDYGAVRDRLIARFPDLPTQIVQGPVCRPEWLIEVEGIAATAVDNPDLAAF